MCILYCALMYPHSILMQSLFFFFNDTATTEIYTLSLHDALPISWIMKPVGFTPGKKYPLILNIHGGPHTAYGYIFFHEMQLMAARGYVVVYPNPRGSTTYGQEFGNVIQYNYPGDDYKDLMVARSEEHT